MSKQILEKLGFSDKESAIYVALLHYGAMTPAALGRITGIHRPTVYSVAKELIKKGVVLEDLGGRSRVLIAKAPEDLAILVNREQRALDAKKATVQTAIDVLKHIVPSSRYAIPKIVFIPEEEIEAYLYKQTLAWITSMQQTDTPYLGFQDPGLVEHYQEWILWYWKQKGAPDVHLLSNESPAESAMRARGFPRRHIRFWSGAATFTATTWVMGNYLVMLNTTTHPFSLIEIHDAMIAENLRQLFHGIWKSLSNTKPSPLA